MTNATMYFSIAGGGASYGSIYSILIEIKTQGKVIQYSSLTTGGASSTLCDASTRDHEPVPYKPILNNFADHDVEFECSGGVFIGGVTQVKMKIYSITGDTNTPVYDLRKGFTMDGTIVSKVELYTRMSRYAFVPGLGSLP